MSGGVDSSVAAARVAHHGFTSFGVTLALWPHSRELVRDRGCCSLDAVDDARRVAAKLGMRHYVWNMEREFTAEVVDDYAAEYAQGRTPNPCVRCNERIKFGVLLERAIAAGATHLATGHYARVTREDDSWALRRARDQRKDQSYALHRLDQRQLQACIFPLGDTAGKNVVRAEAAALGLATAAKPESQDLCFVDGSVPDDLRRRLAGRFRPGPIVDGTGHEVGRHPGLPFFTVGQRTGLGIAPATPASAPMHVIELRMADNTLVVGERDELLRSEVELDDSHWTSEPPETGIECLAQMRAHGSPAPATVVGSQGVRTTLELREPSAAISPGQSLVLYDGDRVLGGGIVRAAA